MRAVREAGSTRASRKRERSICIPRSQVDLPEWLWPPHFTARSSPPLSRAKSTAVRISATPVGCTIRAGNFSNDGFRMRRDRSYPSSPAKSTRPRSRLARSAIEALDSVTSRPSPVTAVTSGGRLGASR